MAERDPVAEQPFLAGDTGVTPWPEAQQRLAEGDTFWLATVRPDGRPHLTPVLAVWVDEALHFCAGAATRKARNLAHDAHCVVAVGAPELDLLVEGEAAKVRDEARLRRVAAAYSSKYDWHPTVRDGAFHDKEGAPTAGPPPYDVYEIVPTTAAGLPTDLTLSPTRWRFRRSPA